MKSTLITVGTLGGVAALGGLAGATLSHDAPTRQATADQPAAVEVRTQVIHKTERLVRHVHHRQPRPAAPAAAVPATHPIAAPAPAVSAQPAPAVRAVAPGPRIVTRTSGAGAGGGHEHDGGDEHEGGGDD